MGAEVIDKLSIVDLWLLLSASYYHDLGMVITRDDKLECLKEGSAFINYVRSKQNDETSPMHNYALCFEIKDNKLFHKNNEITPENIDAQKFLFADYIRQEHADRVLLVFNMRGQCIYREVVFLKELSEYLGIYVKLMDKSRKTYWN